MDVSVLGIVFLLAVLVVVVIAAVALVAVVLGIIMVARRSAARPEPRTSTAPDHSRS